MKNILNKYEKRVLVKFIAIVGTIVCPLPIILDFFKAYILECSVIIAFGVFMLVYAILALLREPPFDKRYRTLLKICLAIVILMIAGGIYVLTLC